MTGRWWVTYRLEPTHQDDDADHHHRHAGDDLLIGDDGGVPEQADRQHQQRTDNDAAEAGQWTVRQTGCHMEQLNELRRADPERHPEITQIDHLSNRRPNMTAANAEKGPTGNHTVGSGARSHQRHRGNGQCADQRADDNRRE
jgi:hypothetical protein